MTLPSCPVTYAHARTHARTYAHTHCPMSDPLAGGNGTESILLEANNLRDVFITDLIYFHLQPGKKD